MNTNDEMIKKMIVWIESSKDFIIDQTPEYIKEYITYETIKTWFNISFLFICIVILFLFAFYCIKKYNTYEKSYQCPTFICAGCFFPFFIIAFMFIILINEIHAIMQIYISPKVYILSHLKGLLK